MNTRTKEKALQYELQGCKRIMRAVITAALEFKRLTGLNRW